jgi:hypothetical protein
MTKKCAKKVKKGRSFLQKHKKAKKVLDKIEVKW